VRTSRQLEVIESRQVDCLLYKYVLLKLAQFKPLASFMLVFEPDLILIFVWSSLYYALWYAVL